MNWIQKLAVKVLGIKIPEPISHYQEKIIEFALKKAENDKVVFVGDSITEGWLTVPYLSKSVLDYGIAGDVTTGVLNRVEQIINAKPKKVLINIGVNDLSTKNALVVSNYRKILERLVQELPPQNVICCAVRPVNYLLPLVVGLYSDNVPIRNLNLSIKNMCSELGCVFEPETYSVHVIPWTPDEIMNPEHTVDGLHLSPLGYSTEYAVIGKYLM